MIFHQFHKNLYLFYVVKLIVYNLRSLLVVWSQKDGTNEHVEAHHITLAYTHTIY